MEPRRKEGFPNRLFDVVTKKRLNCYICHNVVRHAYQSSSGFLYCKGCIPPRTKEKFSPDIAIDKEIEELQIHCEKLDLGCLWVGKVKDLKDHLDTCSPINMETNLQKEASKEKQTEPEPVEISEVFETVKAEDEKDKPNISKASERLCIFNSVGCKEDDLQDKSKEVHMKSHHNVHVLLLLQLLVTMHERVSRALNIPTDLDLSVSRETAGLTLKEVPSTINEIKGCFTQLQNSIRNYEKDFSKIVDKIERLNIFINGTHGNDVLEKMQRSEEQLLEYDTRQNKRATLLEDIQTSLDQKFQRAAEFEIRLEDLFQTVKEMESKNRLPSGSELQAKNINVIRHCPFSLEELPAIIYPPPGSEDFAVSYNGTFLWRIPNVNDMVRKAIQKTVRSFYSPPFFTGPQGYQLCGRVFLFGDGSSNGFYVSMYIAILKGPNDALLPWPFISTVQLTLIDQISGKHHIEEFRTDPDSSSFHRPTSAVNKASGCPRFLPVNQIFEKGYVKDDTMFIRIKVAKKTL